MRDYSACPDSALHDDALYAEIPEDEANASTLYLTLPNEYAGLRLDQALVKLFPDYSRSRLQTWIIEGQVTLNAAPTTPKQKVWGGEDLVVIPHLHPAEQPYQAQNIALDIIYEDDTLLVINKPVGLVVHPGSGNWAGTLLNALLFHAPQLGDVPRAGIVHRLDKDTSGLLVVAKTLIAQTHLVRQLQARSVKREYLALVHGEMQGSGSVDAPIGRHPTQRVKMAVVPDGKPAITHYQIATRYPSCTLLRCRLETGRTHQIRVHLSHLGYPLVGDRVYLKGAQKCVPELRAILSNFPRQALHATRLALVHPDTETRMEWQIDMPHDMQDLLRQIEAVDQYP